MIFRVFLYLPCEAIFFVETSDADTRPKILDDCAIMETLNTIPAFDSKINEKGL